MLVSFRFIILSDLYHSKGFFFLKYEDESKVTENLNDLYGKAMNYILLGCKIILMSQYFITLIL